jgi:hypothetical protein
VQILKLLAVVQLRTTSDIFELINSSTLCIVLLSSQNSKSPLVSSLALYADLLRCHQCRSTPISSATASTLASSSSVAAALSCRKPPLPPHRGLLRSNLSRQFMGVLQYLVIKAMYTYRSPNYLWCISSVTNNLLFFICFFSEVQCK